MNICVWTKCILRIPIFPEFVHFVSETIVLMLFNIPKIFCSSGSFIVKNVRILNEFDHNLEVIIAAFAAVADNAAPHLTINNRWIPFSIATQNLNVNNYENWVFKYCTMGTNTINMSVPVCLRALRLQFACQCVHNKIEFVAFMQWWYLPINHRVNRICYSHLIDTFRSPCFFSRFFSAILNGLIFKRLKIAGNCFSDKSWECVYIV